MDDPINQSSTSEFDPNDQSDNTTIINTPADGSSVLLNLESMIKSNLSAISKLEDEYKKLKGMFDDIFENDPTYKQHNEQAKEASKIKSATKAQILKQPQVAELNEKIKTLKGEIKDMQGAVSDYVNEFHRMTGVTEIETDEGEILEIIQVSRLVKKNSRYRE